MKTLKSALNNLSHSMEARCLPSGDDGHTSTLVGTNNASALSGKASSTTGQAETLLAEDSRAIGPQLGGVIAVAKPRTADEAEALALRLVGDLLPPSVEAWLRETEYHSLVVASVGGQPPAKPNLSQQDRETVKATLQSLTEILAPAHTRGSELDVLIGKMFAAFNVYTGDEGKLRAQVMVWAEELEGFPLYAIRKAYKWAIRSETKLPTLAAFICDVRLAIGAGVLERKRLLERLY